MASAPVGLTDDGSLPSAGDLRERLFEARKKELLDHVASHVKGASLDGESVEVPLLDWMKDEHHVAVKALRDLGYRVNRSFKYERHIVVSWGSKESARLEEVARHHVKDCFD